MERAGVGAEVLRSVLADNSDAMPPDVALAWRFTRATLAHDPAADDYRDVIVERWGRGAGISLAFAFTAARMYPTVTSGSRSMPDGGQQQPGGWNRVLLHVQDLAALITYLKDVGVRFRNQLEVGPGGKQIQIEDPEGNPIELFEPARH